MDDSTAEKTTFEKALEAVETAVPAPDPHAPSCDAYRLRPSEEAALLLSRTLNPPPPWGIKINLARLFLGPDKCLTLGRKLLLNSTVTYLDLSMNDMGEVAAEHFFKLLSRNKTLKHLSVNGNDIGDRGAVASAPCLLTLESFHCSSNNITDAGVEAIAGALRKSNTLKTLSVRNNRISAEGVAKLIEALQPQPEDTQVQIPCRSSPTSAADERSTSASQAKREKTNYPSTAACEQNTGDKTVHSAASSPVDLGQPLFNETLHTMWIDQNVSIPEEMFTLLAEILSKRFPKAPETGKKKKKTAKKA